MPQKDRDKRGGRCLICGETPVQSRGLCSKHHSRYHRQLRKMTPEQKQAYEKTLIERGLLLMPKPPGRQINNDPFQEVAAELFVAESGQPFSTAERSGEGKAGKKKSAGGSRGTKKKAGRTTKAKASGAKKKKKSGG